MKGKIMINKNIQVSSPLRLLIVAALIVAIAAPFSLADTEKAKEFFNEGVKYEQENNEMAAMGSYQQALKEDPNYADAYLNLGTIFFKKKEYDNALKQFKTATEKAPQNKDAFANLGRVQYIMKRYLEAEESFKSAIAIDANDAQLYKELGKVYYRKKNYKEVVSTLGKCHEMGAGDYITYYYVGKSYEQLDDNANAIEAFKQSIAKEDNYSAHSSLGTIYLNQQKFKSAASSFRAALKADPKKYRAAYNYAIAVESDNPEDYGTNITNWENFINLAKNNPKAKNDVATARDHVKELKDAKEQAGLQ